MDSLQKSTKPEKSNDVDYKIRPYSQLTNVQRGFVDYKAIGGLMTDDEGNVTRLTTEALAAMLGVTRTALYKAKDELPYFWDLVNERRAQIGGQTRLAKVYNGLYLKAATGNPQAVALYLANFDSENFRMPTEKHEHDVGGGLLDLLQAGRKRRIANAPAPIEGEVINKPPEQPADVPKSNQANT